MKRSIRPGLVLLLGLLGAALVALLRPEFVQAAPAGKSGHRAGLTAGLDCSACHTPASWKTLGAGANGAGFDHARTGFPLQQRHTSVPCVGCHRSDRALSRQCSGCHEDAHAGQLGSACDECHSAAGWRQTAAQARHRLTRLPLTGMHALVDCRDCHQRTTERTWTTTSPACFGCHAADYRRPDIHPSHIGVAGDASQPAFSRDCSLCHRTTGWVPAFLDARFVASTGQALLSPRAHDRVFLLSSGPHRDADCASCHASPAAPRAVRCNGCHAHDEVKLRDQHRQVAGFGQSCLLCHPGGRAR